MRYSYSRIDLFNKCKKAFKFKYIDKKKEPPSDPQIIGHTTHEIKAEYIRHLIKTSRQTDLDALSSMLDNYKATLNDEQFTDTAKIIDRFSNNWLFPEGVKDPIVDELYCLDRQWKQVDADSPQRFFSFKIDLFYPVGTKAIIYDWKTNRHLPPQSAINKSLQLAIYSMVAGHLHPELDEFEIILYFSRYGVGRSLILTKEDNFDTEQKLMKMIEKIENETEFNARPGSEQCDYCGFKGLCPLYQDMIKELNLVQIDNKKTAEEMAKKLYTAQIFCKDMKKSLKAYVENNGGISIGDFRLDNALTEKIVYPDTEETVKFLVDNGIDKTAIWDNMSLSNTDVKKLLKKDKDLKEEILKLSINKAETHFKFTKE